MDIRKWTHINCCIKQFSCLWAKPSFRQLTAYLFWGACSMLFNICVFYLFIILGLNYNLANIITLILLKIFVFVTNKLFVFPTVNKSLKNAALEFIKFIIARGASNLIDIFGLVLFVEYFALDPLFSKTILAIIVIAINFITSKWFVFTSRKF